MVTSAAKKAAPAARKPAATPRKTATAKPAKKVAAPKKVKVVRDSFSMPQEDYALIAKLKEKALAAGMTVKKSALLRAGLQLLDKSSALQLKRVLSGLTPIKTGRPKKH
jgi:hypothetical protein